MKLPTAAPSESGMRYFTPELYLRYNSAADAVADAADAEWEAAIASYRQDLAALAADAPKEVSSLAELDLHDAEVVPVPTGPHGAILFCRGVGGDIAIRYVQRGPQRIHRVAGWPFSPERVHWLFDELDRGSEGGWVHRVLLSDGRVITTPFGSVTIDIGPGATRGQFAS